MDEEHKPLVAIVDDDSLIVESFADEFSDEFQIRTFTSPIDAQKTLPTQHVSLVIADLRMPALDGIELLASLKHSVPNVTRILFTAYADLECLSRAINHASIFHYIAKDSLGRKGAHSEIVNIILRGVELSQVREERDHLLRRIVEQAESLLEENEQLKEQRPRLLDARYFSDLIGNSPNLKAVINRAREAARHNFPVLIYGETGTGKEILSRAIHFEGLRRAQRFVAVNCGAVQKDLLISELMGYTKGAFTGATENRAGVLEVVDKGTLFLDEIGDMPIESQAHLLRFLESGEVRPIGSAATKNVDVRIIAATNKNLRDEVRAGRFREDLYYRLNSGIELTLPPLRDRLEDLPLLIVHLLQKSDTQQTVTEISQEALDVLGRCEFRGNIRELAGALRKASIDAMLSGANVLLPYHFPGGQSSGQASRPANDNWKTLNDNAQTAFIVSALREHKTITATAVHLGLTREGLSRRMKSLGIKNSEGT
jgi:two-component system, NtrC family, response regulator HupR/HoxA